MNLGRTEHADPYLPGHGSLAWSVAHYDLELDYKVAGNRLDARARLRVVAAEELSRISLDLAHLRVSKVSADGRRVTRFRHHGGKLHVTLRLTAAAGRERAGDGAVLRRRRSPPAAVG